MILGGNLLNFSIMPSGVLTLSFHHSAKSFTSPVDGPISVSYARIFDKKNNSQPQQGQLHSRLKKTRS